MNVKKLKLLRIQRGFSQLQLAEASGINEKYYGRIERGESIPTIAVVEKISQALNMSLIDFIQMLENNENSQ